MDKHKNILVIFVVGLISLLLTACGGGGSSGGQAKNYTALCGSCNLSLKGAVSTLAGYQAFISPVDIASDGTNLYVADRDNNKIRKIVIATGVVTTLAGSGAAYTALDGVGTAASFWNPSGLTTDGTNLYVADSRNNKIRKIVIATGVVTTLAGGGNSVAADGVGTAASFGFPQGLTTDGTNLYVADSGSNKIRKIVIATGAVTTLAGSGTAGAADGVGTAASFYNPSSITTDGTNLYVADSGSNKIRKIVIATGAVTTLAGSGTPGAADGVGTTASFNNPYGLTTDGTSLYVVDSGNSKIRKIVISTGVVTTLVGSGSPGAIDGIGTAVSFYGPSGIITDGTNLYVADSGNSKIRKIVIATGTVTTLAGGSVDGAGVVASFSYPKGLTSDGTNLYVADTGNQKIRKIVIATGVVTTLAGSGIQGSVDGVGTAASFGFPQGLTTDGNNLYIADSGSNKIRKIVIATGAVSTLAGSGTTGAVDGVGAAASFNYPAGITTDGTSLYVADSWNNKIRKIVIATGAVTTLAGNGTQGSVDGVGTTANLSGPSDITTDGTNLYVADSFNNKIRKVVIATGVVTTLAGNGTAGAVDDIGTAASFYNPYGITTDGFNLYVADTVNYKIRKIVIATGVVTTLAGGTGGAVDGIGTAASFSGLYGITTDGTSLYVADTGNCLIRVIK